MSSAFAIGRLFAMCNPHILPFNSRFSTKSHSRCSLLMRHVQPAFCYSGTNAHVEHNNHHLANDHSNFIHFVEKNCHLKLNANRKQCSAMYPSITRERPRGYLLREQTYNNNNNNGKNRYASCLIAEIV